MSLIFDKSIKVKLLYSLLIVICLLALLVVFLPVGIQMAGQSWLRDQGLDANIEFVGFNLNTGTFLVENANGLNKDKRGFVLGKAHGQEPVPEQWDQTLAWHSSTATDVIRLGHSI